MKAAFVVGLAFVTSCVPSTSDYARGTADAGAPMTITAPDAGASDAAAPVEAGAVDAGSLPKSCKDSNTTTDGFVKTTHGDVYCNMTIDGGGWTMIGRSHDEQDGADQNQPFGWTSSSGDAHDTNHPYSLGVLNLDFDFTQVLVAEVDDVGTMALGQTYELKLTKTELAANGNSNFSTDGVSTVKGSCKPANGRPTMLRHAGYTSATNQFHFRDVDQTNDSVSSVLGLVWSGFDTFFDDCDQGGNLYKQAGAIFVR